MSLSLLGHTTFIICILVKDLFVNIFLSDLAQSKQISHSDRLYY